MTSVGVGDNVKTTVDVPLTSFEMVQPAHADEVVTTTKRRILRIAMTVDCRLMLGLGFWDVFISNLLIE